MIRGNDINQVQLFSTPFEQELHLENRWVKFSNIIPWNKLSSFYYRTLKTNDAVALFCPTDKDLKGNKNGKKAENSVSSREVARTGIEPVFLP